MTRLSAPPRALTWSYGGGTQSVAILLLIAQGRLPKPEVVLMADTGREKTATWRYTEAYARPLLAELGLELHIVSHNLATVDLYSTKSHTLLIPAWTKTGQFSTFCSGEWKAEVIRRYLRSLGYGPKRPIRTWLGMSLDELGRMKPSHLHWQEIAWPLVFDVPLTRHDCVALIARWGWPPAPKSACWMCPFTRNAEWARERAEDPQDWDAAVAFDAALRAGGDPDLWLHKSRVPLAEADLSVPERPPLPLFGEMEGCDSGYCMV